MKYNLTKTLLACLVFFTLHAHAQIAGQLKTYPAYIIHRVLLMNDRVKLTEERQIKIAGYLYHQDSLANAKKTDGVPLSEIHQYFPNDNEVLALFLTPVEMIDLKTAQIYSTTSELSKAVKYREKLQLNNTQIGMLLDKIQQATLYTFSQAKKYKRIEFAELNNILSVKQLKRYFDITDQEKAKSNADDDWNLLKDRGLAANKDSVKVWPVMYDFQTENLSRIDYLQNCENGKNIDNVRDSLERIKPLVVHEADILKGQMKPCALLTAFSLKTELHLTNEQTALIVSDLAHLRMDIAKQKNLPAATAFDYKISSARTLKAILSDQQYHDFWMVSNKLAAKAFANSSWVQIKALGIATQQDSARICNQTLNFKLRQLIALDTIGFFHPGKTDSVKRFSNLDRPYVLWKLDALNSSLPFSMLSAAITDRGDLKLTDVQIDTILVNLMILEKKKAVFNYTYPNLYLNDNSSHMQCLIRVMSNEQYTKFLTYKNQTMAQNKADQDWDALSKAGLIAAGTEKIKVMTENRTYELKWLAANERLSYDHTQKNLFAKQSVENRKPELLKKLDLINYKTATDKHLKDAFAW